MPPAHIEFEWDPAKAERNIRRHQITFEEAVTAFDDEYAIIFADEAHSFDEPRDVLIGYSNRAHLLTVIFTERGDVVRLISARQATRGEKKRYEEEKRF